MKALRLTPLFSAAALALVLGGCNPSGSTATGTSPAPEPAPPPGMTSGSTTGGAAGAPDAHATGGATVGGTTSGGTAAGEAAGGDGKPVPVKMETSKGVIELELYPDKAPITVKNFVSYAKKGHYNGTVFHRVIPGFMIQGGGMTPDLNEKSTDAPIKNEAGNGLKNERGTVAMARTGVVDSATAQFFINVSKNTMLDHKDDSQQGFGYAVFGKVTKGMDVADKIVAVSTTSKGPHDDVPVEPITIKSVTVK